MKKFTKIFVLIFALITLVACGGGPTLDTTNEKTFAESFDVMYGSLSKSEQAGLLLYLPVTIYKGTILDGALKEAAKMKLPSDEQILRGADMTIMAFKELVENKDLLFGATINANLESINGLTAAEIIDKGKGILVSYGE